MTDILPIDPPETEPLYLADCPVCGCERVEFLISDGKCDLCRACEAQQAEPPFERGWPEVRQRRDMLIQQTDWTVLPDVPEATRDLHLPIRQALRDVTQEATPQDAWNALDQIEADLNPPAA